MGQPEQIRTVVNRVMADLHQREKRLASRHGGCPEVLVRDEALSELLADMVANDQTPDEYADQISGRD